MTSSSVSAPVEGATTTLVLTFRRERETKNMWRFQERHDVASDPMIGVLYVRKAFLAKLGDPPELQVTVEVSR